MIKQYGLGINNFSFMTFGFGTATYNPVDLFAAGQQGVFYDPSDLTTLFKDVAGTQPVTADGDPVGLILDKSHGLELGAELVLNGDFSAGGQNWSVPVTYPEVTVDFTGGKAKISAIGATISTTYLRQTIATVIGATYKASIHIDGLKASASNTITGHLLINSLYLYPGNNTAKTLSGYFVATSTSTLVDIRSSSTSTTDPVIYYDNVTVKEIKGNHARQSVSAARPTYQTDGILHKLVFDGADDCMIATLNVALSASGKLTLGVGVNAINTSTAFIIEQGASSSSFNSFNLAKSSGEYTYTGRGNRVAMTEDITKVNTPLSRVVAIAEHDLNAGIPSSLTVNNLAKANSIATDFGGGGFGSASLNIGSINGGSLFYKGDMYGIVVVGDVTSAANKDSLKQYLAAKAGVTL